MGQDEPLVASNAFGGAIPIFRVESLEACIDYYIKVLGFTLHWREASIMAAVSRNRCEIFPCEGHQGHTGTWAWIGVTDAESLCAEFRQRGARVRHPPTNYPWAYEMQVEDPEGNVLRFGSDPKPDEPFGPWLDMRGATWVHSPGGGWMRAEPRA